MIRDQHFSVISYFLKKIQNLKRLTNAQEIVDALNNYQDQSNERNIKKRILPFNYLAVIIPSQDKITHSNRLDIAQIESLYNFQNIDGTIHTTVFSDLTKLIAIPAKSQIDVNGSKVKKQPVKRLDNNMVNINHLKKKRENIEQDIRIAINDDGKINIMTPDDNQIPLECFKRIKNGHHEKCCQEICNFSIEEISNLTGTRLIPELLAHKHASQVVKIKTTKKTTFLSIEEKKQELILHYNIHHNKF